MSPVERHRGDPNDCPSRVRGEGILFVLHPKPAKFPTPESHGMDGPEPEAYLETTSRRHRLIE